MDGMDDLARQTLRELVATHGTDLCSDARRCEGLLRDFCGERRREIFVLVSALRDGVAAELLNPPRHLPLDAHLALMSRRLEEHLALSPTAARWAVESWATALDIPLNLAAPAATAAPVPAGDSHLISPGEAPSETGSRASAAMAWAAGVAVLWAVLGASTVAQVASALGATAHQGQWMAAGALAGAALGVLAGAMARAAGGVPGALATGAIGGTVGGAALGAFLGAAAGGVTGLALESPAVAATRAQQWGAAGATTGALLSTLLGAAAWRAATWTEEPEA